MVTDQKGEMEEKMYFLDNDMVIGNITMFWCTLLVKHGA
jgi:hypothetical protein